MGSYKLGDNIVYNLGILNELYRISSEDRRLLPLFRKLKLVLIVSIIEAILYDLHFRAKHYTREGVQNIPPSVLKYIRSKSVDKFEQLIVSSRKHKIFDALGEEFYGDLDMLRKLRNRVHIQNEKNDFESDDFRAFSSERLIVSEKALERVCRFMLLRHPRSERHRGVKEFKFPWPPHFPEN